MGCTEDEYNEDQGQSEVGGAITPKNITTIDSTVNPASDQISFYNTDDEFVLTRSPVDTPKPPSQPASVASYSSGYTPITALTSALSSSSLLPSSLTSSS